MHRRCFKRHSRAALNRQQELSHLPMPPQLRLYDYLQRRKERKPAPAIDLKISKIGNVSSQHTQDLTSMYTLFTYADRMELTEAVYYLVDLLPHNEIG